MIAESNKRWYWAWLIQKTVAKAKANNPSARCEVWKNLIAIRASDPATAYAKAYRIGQSEAGDCKGTLRYNGGLAITTFLGIGDMGIIHDQLRDGGEILWQLKRCTQSRATTLAIPKRQILAQLRKELTNS